MKRYGAVVVEETSELQIESGVKNRWSEPASPQFWGDVGDRAPRAGLGTHSVRLQPVDSHQSQAGFTESDAILRNPALMLPLTPPGGMAVRLGSKYTIGAVPLTAAAMFGFVTGDAESRASVCAADCADRGISSVVVPSGLGDVLTCIRSRGTGSPPEPARRRDHRARGVRIYGAIDHNCRDDRRRPDDAGRHSRIVLRRRDAKAPPRGNHGRRIGARQCVMTRAEGRANRARSRPAARSVLR